MAKQRSAKPRVRARDVRRTRRLRNGLAVAGGAVAVAALVAVAIAAGSGGGSRSGVTAPENWELPALDGDGGETVALADFRGTPVVLNFFASWCTSCDFELPGFRRVSEELRGEVTFVGVNALEDGDGMLMPRRHDITWWPLVRDVGGRNGSGLHQALGGRGMPITAFYDAEGRLVDFAGGALPERALRDILRELYGVDV